MPDTTLATLNDALISKLAREVARAITPIPQLLGVYKLTQAQFDKLVESQIFHQRLVEEQAIWNASDPMTIAKRIGAKASSMIEESLSELYAMILDPQQPMNAKVEALKLASRWAGIGENANVKPGMGDDAKIRINIMIGGKTVAFDKEKLPARVIDGTAVELTPDSVR